MSCNIRSRTEAKFLLHERFREVPAVGCRTWHQRLNGFKSDIKKDVILMINKHSLIFMAILFVSSIELSCSEETPANAIVRIEDFSFQPDFVSVESETTVVWINDDSAPHTITADDSSFDSGSIGKGSEFKHTFHQPGNYSYHCAIHPSMTGKIAVTEAKPDPSSDPSAPSIGL